MLCVREVGLDYGRDSLPGKGDRVVGRQDPRQVSRYTDTSTGPKRPQHVPSAAISLQKTRLAGSSGDGYSKCSTTSPDNLSQRHHLVNIGTGVSHIVPHTEIIN